MITENPFPSDRTDDRPVLRAGSERPWLSVPEAAERLGIRDRDVRALLRDRVLAGARREGGRGPQIPAQTIVEVDGAPSPLPSLRGTLITLADCGLDEIESLEWLLTVEDELGTAPLDALLAGRTHAVRSVARTLL